MDHSLAIELVTGVTPEVEELIGELDHELSQHYSSEQRHGLNLAAIFQHHIRFYIARLGEKAVGCGGIALFDDFGELKRMYVKAEFRGNGVADALVTTLEGVALSAGFRWVRLETGTAQFAAMRFYERCGYSACDAFEPYASMPPHSISTSLFYEKQL